MTKSRFITLLFVGSLLLSGTPVFSTNYYVGPGLTYTSLSATLTDSLSPGDTVFVNGNHTYPGNVNFNAHGTASDKIVIKGVLVNGNKPIISGGANTVSFWGNHYIFDGLVVKSGTARGVHHVADDITIRNCVIRDCPAMGIIGADFGSGSLTLEYSEMYNCGGPPPPGTWDGYSHCIYMCTDQTAYPGSFFRMQHCYIHDNLGGNLVKSRAERNEIYYNWLEAGMYKELEMLGPDLGNYVNRMDGDVVGNVFIHKTANGAAVRVGGDGMIPPNQTVSGGHGRYRFVNNTFIFKNGSYSLVVRAFTKVESIEMHNNVIYRQYGGASNLLDTTGIVWTQGHPIFAGSNNWVMNGTTNIPAVWTGTLMGNSNPGFVNLSTYDVNLTSGSVLVNAGDPNPTSPPGYDFPNPLSLPAFEPVLHAFNTAAMPRTVNGVIDIGAYEYMSATAIADISSDGSVLVFPNPANGKFIVKMNELIQNADGKQLSDGKIEICNLSGESIYHSEISDLSSLKTGVAIDISSQPAGIYFLKISTGAGIAGKKIVIR